MTDRKPPEEVLFNRKKAAQYLGDFSPGTLAVWACTKRYDLKFIKIGRSVRYRKSDLDAFLARQMDGSEAPIMSRKSSVSPALQGKVQP